MLRFFIVDKRSQEIFDGPFRTPGEAEDMMTAQKNWENSFEIREEETEPRIPKRRYPIKYDKERNDLRK